MTPDPPRPSTRSDDDPPADRPVRIAVPEVGTVSGLLRVPSHDRPARALLVLAHGAGAGMRHPFMQAVAEGLAVRGLATLRYQFPYMEAGKKRPDRAPVAKATVEAAVQAALRAAVATAPDAAGGDLPEPGPTATPNQPRDPRPGGEAGLDRNAGGIPVLAGGKSFGGRMTSQAAADGRLDDVRGLVFLGFPLHPAGRPGTDRAQHLASVPVPMLFVQGTRDALADLDLLRPILERLNDADIDPTAPRRLPARAELHVVDGGDHSFKVLKRSGRTGEEVLAEICDAVLRFVSGEDP